MASPQENSAAFTKLNAYFGGMYKGAEASPFEQLARINPSQDLSERYDFPGGTPRMQRQGLNDETKRSDVNLHTHTLSNSKFGMSVPVAEIFIITGKLGTILPSVADMGVAAARWRGDLVQEQLLHYADFKGYDGKPLFSATHKDGGQTQSNIIDGGGTTVEKISTDLAKVQAAKAQVRDDRGNIIGSPDIDTIVIPSTASLIEAFRVLASGKQAQGQADWSGDIRRVLQLPGWTGNSWMAFDTAEGVKAFIVQVLQEATTKFAQDPDREEGDMLFRCSAFGEGGVGNWRRGWYVDND